MSDPPVAPPAPGTLLVALPTLEDPNFHQTVILLLGVDAEHGAMGVVLNRPNEVPVGALLPGWGELAAPPDSLFVGGPVSRDSVIGLGAMKPSFADGEVEGCAPVPGGAGRLATVDLNRSPCEMGEAIETVRIFSGYAGWGGGQLEGELSEGSWVVVPSLAADSFTDDPSTLWIRVLERQGGHIALYAKAPPRLSMN